jgi:MinD-like ATPase involved in chromosome partitioning or flagellar assembly
VRGRASLTLSLARDLARQGRRVLLLDADYAHPRLWMSTDFPHESLLGAISASGEGPPAGEGTEGVRLLTLDVDLSSLDDIGAVQRASLATWFGSAEEEAHVILVSASSSLSRQMRAVLRASATIVVVTPTSADEIVHVYGAIKRLTRINPEARVGIVAGGGTCDRPQAPVGKLQRVVRRFLDRRLHDFGYLATPGSGAIVSRHLQARSLDARGPTLTQRLFGPL